MPELAGSVSLSLLVVGGLLALSIVLRPVMRGLGVPPLVGFILLGFGLRLADSGLGFLSADLASALQLLAGAGFLFAAAVIGKVLGAGLPALALDGPAGASLIGVSMVPRAEIALVILDEGRRLGPWAVSSELFATMVLVSLAT